MYRIDMAVGGGYYITLPELYENKKNALIRAGKEQRKTMAQCKVRRYNVLS